MTASCTATAQSMPALPLLRQQNDAVVTINGDSEPQELVKRQRRASTTKQPTATAQASRIFAPYRTIGLISPTNVPFTALPLGKTTFQITTSTGRSLQTYDLRRGLTLVFLTRPQTPGLITATFAWKSVVYAAWSGEPSSAAASRGIWVFERGRRIAELETAPDQREPVDQLLVFGNWIVGCTATTIEVWRNDTFEHYTSIRPSPCISDNATHPLTGALCTVPTLLNKILIGKQDGRLELWNISIGKLVHTSEPPSQVAGAVTALEPSPALHIVAVARADGSVTLQDIRLDKTLMTFRAESSAVSSVTSISFRTDGYGAGEDGRQDGIMATASTEHGDVTFWDLNKGGRVTGVLHHAHNPSSAAYGGVSGGISGLAFLPGQPVLVTSGRDNALKTWIFDQHQLSSIPRPLHARSGHAAPVTRLDFVPAEADGADALGKWLLSGARDRSLWGWSLRRDAQSTELSQGQIQRKAKKMLSSTLSNLDDDTVAQLEDLKVAEITCMACCLNRDGGMGASTGGGPVWANITGSKNNNRSDEPVTGWESVVTGHKGDRCARTWFWGRKKAGRWALESGDRTEVTAVTMSPCGTFALIGSAGGSIVMYNLQSGIRRQRFPPIHKGKKASKKQQRARPANGHVAESIEIGHTQAVTGLVVDNLNQTVISSSLDGQLIFWDFARGTIQHKIDWSDLTAITALRFHRGNDLVALSCDDLSIRVVDIETRRMVRELVGSVGPIKDHAFSPDGRWLVAASLDTRLRVWDLPTGHLIDVVRLAAPCVALAWSPTGEFLATAHAESIGLSIWSNRALFTHVSTRHIDEDSMAATTASLPTTTGEGGAALIEAAYDTEVHDQPTDEGPASTTEQLSADLTTLSLVPRSRWHTLLHLDLIAARNKPQEPPKLPEKAPFFLPSLENKPPGLNESKTQQNGPDNAHIDELVITAAERSRIGALQRHGANRPFTAFLHNINTSEQGLEQWIAHLKSLGPAAADVEIRSLDSGAGEPARFVQALTRRLEQRRDYELVQAWMAAFLRAHLSSLSEIASTDMHKRTASADLSESDRPDHALADEDLIEALTQWRAVQASEAARLADLTGYCAGVLGFLRSAR